LQIKASLWKKLARLHLKKQFVLVVHNYDPCYAGGIGNHGPRPA
jgi:hypothetical protein